jgi:hypothetical protein
MTKIKRTVLDCRLLRSPLVERNDSSLSPTLKLIVTSVQILSISIKLGTQEL